MLLFLLPFIFLLSNIGKYRSESVFNYEIGARVNDNLSDFLGKIKIALGTALSDVQANIVNITDPEAALRIMYFSTKKLLYNDLISTYVGLENGLFYQYRNKPALPNGMFFEVTDHKNALGVPVTTQYIIRPDGKSTGNVSLLGASGYDCRTRPWYVAGKAALSPVWVAPYLDVTTNFPTTAIVYPITNFTLNGVYMHFVGNLGAGVFLSQISTYLKTAYQNTDRDVFLVEKNTGNLIGSSLNANTYYFDVGLNINVSHTR